MVLGDKFLWYPECVQLPLPLRKNYPVEAQLKLPIGYGLFVFCRMEKLRDSAARMATDGLNSMKYTVNKITEHLLYTQVKADVKKKWV